MSIASFESEHGKFRVDRLAQRLMLNGSSQGPVIIPKNELSNAQSLMEINLSSSLRSSTPPLPRVTSGMNVNDVCPPHESDDELRNDGGHRSASGNSSGSSPPHSRSGSPRRPSRSPRGGHVDGGYPAAVHHCSRSSHHYPANGDPTGGGRLTYHHRSGPGTPRGGDYGGPDGPRHSRERVYYPRHSSNSRRRSRSPVDAHLMDHHQQARSPHTSHRGARPHHYRGNGRMSSLDRSDSEHSYARGRSRSPRGHTPRHHPQRAHPMNGDHYPQHGSRDRSYGRSHTPRHHEEYDDRVHRGGRRDMRGRSYRSRSPIQRSHHGDEHRLRALSNSSSGLNLHSLTQAMFPNSPVAPRSHRGSRSRENSPLPPPSSSPVHHGGGHTHHRSTSSGHGIHPMDRTPTHPSAMAVGGDSPSPSSPRHDDGRVNGRLSPQPVHDSRYRGGADISPSASPSPGASPMHRRASANHVDLIPSNGNTPREGHYQQHHGTTLQSPHPKRPVTRSPLRGVTDPNMSPSSPSQSPSPRPSNHGSVDHPMHKSNGRRIIGDIHSPRSGSTPLPNDADATSGAVPGPGSPVGTHHRPLTRHMSSSGNASPSPSPSPRVASGANGNVNSVSPSDSNSQPHRCNVCRKTFPKRHNLITHMATHSKKKPHRCELCNKHFSRKGNMQRHIIALHFGEKPYECEYCKKKFNDSSNMRKHIKNQHIMKLEYDGIATSPSPGVPSAGSPVAGMAAGVAGFTSPRTGSPGGRMFRSSARRGDGTSLPGSLPQIGSAVPPGMIIGVNGLPTTLPPPLMPRDLSGAYLQLQTPGADGTSPQDKFTPTTRRSARVLRNSLSAAASASAALPLPLPLASPSAPTFPLVGTPTTSSTGATTAAGLSKQHAPLLQAWATTPGASGTTFFPQVPGAISFNPATNALLSGLSTGTNGLSRPPLNPTMPLPNPSLTLPPMLGPLDLSLNQNSSAADMSVSSENDRSNTPVGDVPMPLPLNTAASTRSSTATTSQADTSPSSPAGAVASNKSEGAASNGSQQQQQAPLLSALLNPPLPIGQNTEFPMPATVGSPSASSSSGAADPTSPVVVHPRTGAGTAAAGSVPLAASS